jgi:hypothetical protein
MTAQQRNEAIRAISKIDGATTMAESMNKLSLNEQQEDES